ncbi:hypothetical protein F442_18478, partial [Phytophthora nicotianae P10297]
LKSALYACTAETNHLRSTQQFSMPSVRTFANSARHFRRRHRLPRFLAKRSPSTCCRPKRKLSENYQCCQKQVVNTTPRTALQRPQPANASNLLQRVKIPSNNDGTKCCT